MSGGGEGEAAALAAEEFRRYARTHLLGFIFWCWQMSPKKMPFKVGRHTRGICERIDRAVSDYLSAGRTTYLNVNVPFRHGKSEIVSRFLPAYFIGRCADRDPGVILSGYSTSLCRGFSKKVQGIVRSEQYRALFPGVRIRDDHRAAEEWSVEGSQGVVVAQGLEGSITGKGGNLIVVDDYCKDRADAESATMRENTWAAFKDVVMTRLNGAGVVIVCATRWHVDDIVGRIKEGMRRDPGFPRFEDLIYPARKTGPGGWDYLFPEQYPPSWYDAQRATLGSYSAAALLDCSPVSDAMKEFRDEWLCWYDAPPPRERMNVYMFVDPSSGRHKEVGRERSDRTAMAVVGYGADGNRYLLDLVYDRLNLAERTAAAFDLWATWRPTTVFYEQVGMQADVEHIRERQEATGWHFSIVPLPQKVEKETRIRALQPDFEAHRWWFPCLLRKQSYSDGRIYFPLQELVEEEYRCFPGCRHDDGLDCLAHTMHPLVAACTAFPETGEGGADGAGVYRANTAWSAFR